MFIYFILAHFNIFYSVILLHHQLVFYLSPLSCLKHTNQIHSASIQKKTANKLFYNCINLNFYIFLINAFSLFSVFFSITNRGNVASIFFYIYFTKLWLSLSLSLLQPQRFHLSFFCVPLLVYFYFFILSIQHLIVNIVNNTCLKFMIILIN